MKITASQLKALIKEAVEAAMEENTGALDWIRQTQKEKYPQGPAPKAPQKELAGLPGALHPREIDEVSKTLKAAVQGMGTISPSISKNDLGIIKAAVAVLRKMQAANKPS